MVCLIAALVGAAIFGFFNIGNIHYGTRPVSIDEVASGKPYYLQGEEVNFTVTVNNPQDLPVPYPGYVGYRIEKDGLYVAEGGVFIEYAMPIPTFPAHSKTAYSSPLRWDQKMEVSDGTRAVAPPGNYTLTVSFDGHSYGPNGTETYGPSGNCTFEIRARAGGAGVEYTGVKAGDWVRYDIGASWTGSGTEPSSVEEFKQMEWQMVRIQSVSGGVLLELTTHFKNGTDLNYPLAGDLTASGISATWLIFPSGLKKGDTFQLYASPALQNFMPDFVPSIVNVVINDTITRNYAGSSRSVNVLSLTSSNGGVGSGTLYWDQKTGVLLEFVQRAFLPDGTVQLSTKALETNMWEP